MSAVAALAEEALVPWPDVPVRASMPLGAPVGPAPRPGLRAVPATAPGPVAPGWPVRAPRPHQGVQHAADVQPAREVSVLRAPAPARGPLRLTGRGTLVLTVVLVVTGAALLWLASASGSQPAPRPFVRATVTVQQGETLWSIAMRVRPDLDPRQEVPVLVARNHLTSSQLDVGQVLRVR